MKEMIATIFSAPLATVLVVAGIVFLFVAVLGTVAGKIDPGKEGRIAAGTIGAVLLVIGLSMHIVLNIRVAEEAQKQAAEAAQKQAAEAAQKQAAEAAQKQAAAAAQKQAEAAAQKQAEAAAQKQAAAAAQKQAEAAAQKQAEAAAQKQAEAAAQKQAEAAAQKQAEAAAQKQAAEAAQKQAEAAAQKQAAEAAQKQAAAAQQQANPCDPIVVGATCRDFYRERNNWDQGKISRCGLYQVSRYKEALNIDSDLKWSRFLSPCK